MKYKSVVFEGTDGSGKSTIVALLKEELTKKGIPYISPREPGATSIGEQIRSVILNKDNAEMTGDTEMLLFAAARSQNIYENILPAIKDGKFVLLDRFVESSYVYQGYARGIGFEKIKAINDIATAGWAPDAVILLDISTEDAVARIMANPDREKNRLDLEKTEFLRKTREGYLLRAKENPTYHIVDASKPIDEVYASVKEVLGL